MLNIYEQVFYPPLVTIGLACRYSRDPHMYVIHICLNILHYISAPSGPRSTKLGNRRPCKHDLLGLMQDEIDLGLSTCGMTVCDRHPRANTRWYLGLSPAGLYMTDLLGHPGADTRFKKLYHICDISCITQECAV
jgi:hypothetical protein